MLHRALDDRCLRIAGIDPGTDNVGFSVLDYDLENDKAYRVACFSLSGSALMRFLPSEVESIHGAMYARLSALHRSITDHLIDFAPHRVIVERPFYNPRRPSAYGPLVKSIGMIHQAVVDYCPTMMLREIDPSSAKKNAGVRGNSGDKSAVNKALANGRFFDNEDNFDYYALNEHEADSLIVAYYGLSDVRRQHVR